MAEPVNTSAWRLEHWRQIPTLTRAECELLTGCTPAKIAALVEGGRLEVVDELVKVASVLRWLGEHRGEAGGFGDDRAVPTAAARERARTLIDELGGADFVRGSRARGAEVAHVSYRSECRKWEVRIYVCGREKRRVIGGGERGRRAAMALAAAVDELLASAAPAAAAVAGDALPIADTLRCWVDDYRSTFSRGYEVCCRALIRNHLAPFFGSSNLAELREVEVLRFADWMLEKGLSAATVKLALGLLRRCAQIHVEGGALPRNPLSNLGRIVRGIEGRTATQVRRTDAFRRDEVAALLTAARQWVPWLYPLLVFLVSTGARRGEAMGLRWEDLDFDRKEVWIRRAIVRGQETTPKSGRSRRVPMGAAGSTLEPVLRELAAARAGATARVRAAPSVFLSPLGHRLEERNVQRGWFAVRRRAAALGVRPLRMHDLRHTFASHALESGVSVPRVAAWLGHANPEITLRVYAHVVPAEAAPESGFLESALAADPADDLA